MSVLHDYRCNECGACFERFVEVEERTIPCDLCGRGNAERIYRTAGGMLNKAKGRYPYFDTQLGTTVDSPQHRDRVAKSKGLVTVGVDEFNRSRNTAHSPNPLDQPLSDKFADIAKANWERMKAGTLPPVETRPADTESDVLPVNTIGTQVS